MHQFGVEHRAVSAVRVHDEFAVAGYLHVARHAAHDVPQLDLLGQVAGDHQARPDLHGTRVAPGPFGGAGLPSSDVPAALMSPEAGEAAIRRDLGTSVRLYGALLVTSGGNASLILAPKVSVHLGAEWISFAAVGEPDVGPLSALVPEVETIPQQTLHLLESRLAYEIRVQSVVASVATDIRFNRRDSLLIQAAAPIWAWTKLPSWMDKYGGEERGFLDLGECWSAGLAWQAHYRNLDIRVGIGLSSVPGSWIVQTTDLRWRFGGSKRREFRKGLHQWRSGETP